MFQNPKMKLLNFEQFQNMLNQIQISQLSDSSISPKNYLNQQTPYQILNRIVDGKQVSRKTSNIEPVNDHHGSKRTTFDTKLPSSNGLSPLSSHPALSTATAIQQSNENKNLKPSNSNKSISAYSSRSSQLNQQQQQNQQKNNIPKKIIKNQYQNPKNDALSEIINTDLNVVEEDCDQLTNLIGPYEEDKENLQMKELSCSIEEDFDHIGHCYDDIDQSRDYSYNNKDLSSLSEKDNQILINPDFNNSNKNNPTIQKSSSQTMLDPLLQNFNVKKMCEVQKHFCKKRIREFRQPSEDIVQYQEFIKILNDRSSKENVIPQQSSRRIKTDHSVNSIKNKPLANQYNLNINNQQIKYITENQCLNNTNQVTLNRGKLNQLQEQYQNNILPPQNILKVNNHMNQNNQVTKNNSQKAITYSEITSKIFKLKNKSQPQKLENTSFGIQQNGTQFQQQFNSNKENNTSNQGFMNTRNSLKQANINVRNNFDQTSNYKIQNSQSGIACSRDSSVSNYESRNNRLNIPTAKYQNKANILPSAVVNCPTIAQQPQQTYQKQRSLSPFYSKDYRQERDIKKILNNNQKTNNNNNSNNSYNNINDTSFNVCQNNKNLTNKNSTQSSFLTTQNNLHQPISSRSRVSTVEGYDKNHIEINQQLQHNSRNISFSICQQNISKSSDIPTNVAQNVLQNQPNNIQSKNIVTFGQSYFKRQQQQIFKNQKSQKHLNFNCLGYIRKYKEILESQILQNIPKIPKDDIMEYQHAYKQSVLIMNDTVDIVNNDDLTNFQDFLSLRSKNIFNQFLVKYGAPFQI